MIKKILKRILPLPAKNSNEMESRLRKEIFELKELMKSQTEQYLSEINSLRNLFCEFKDMKQQVLTSTAIAWEDILKKRLSDITVKNGPFTGLHYPEFIATGSSLYPKIIGCYEKEIHPVIEKVSDRKYDYVFDVGCAEGYYAVGLAVEYKKKGYSCKVKAFDTNPDAQIMCHNMCIANDVEDYVEICGLCSPEVFEAFNFGKRSLIIADCEGYEREMFTEKNIDNLKHCDLLIEVHDWIQSEIPTLDYLQNLFGKSHNISLTYGIDDYEKAYRYDYPELKNFTIAERFEILREGRRRLGEWLFCEAKLMGGE